MFIFITSGLTSSINRPHSEYLQTLNWYCVDGCLFHWILNNNKLHCFSMHNLCDNLNFSLEWETQHIKYSWPEFRKKWKISFLNTKFFSQKTCKMLKSFHLSGNKNENKFFVLCDCFFKFVCLGYFTLNLN